MLDENIFKEYNGFRGMAKAVVTYYENDIKLYENMRFRYLWKRKKR